MKYSFSPRPRLALFATPVVLALVSGCALVRPVTAQQAEPSREPGVAPVSSAAAPSASAAAPKSGPGAPPASVLRPFAEIVKDARRIDGLFTLWQKDDKVWLELKPADLDQPFFLSPKLKTGIGEGRLYGGLMSDELVIEFRRVHNQLQLLARNTEFVAHAGTPNGRAVQAAFSPSLLASTSVLSQPHPERKSVLVEANALFVNDMLGAGTQLQRTYRQGYSLDTRNSAITQVRATPDLVVVEVQNHYSTGSIQQATPGALSSPSAPRSLPDPRSLFIGLHYSLARLPEEPMKPRKADARVGYFTTAVMDFGDDLARTPRQRYVNRWRQIGRAHV